MTLSDNKEAQNLLNNTLGSIENRMRTAYNLGYRQGRADVLTEEIEKVTKAVGEVLNPDVVRCKDCKHARYETTEHIMCSMWDACYTEAEGFCHRGERR